MIFCSALEPEHTLNIVDQVKWCTHQYSPSYTPTTTLFIKQIAGQFIHIQHQHYLNVSKEGPAEAMPDLGFSLDGGTSFL